MPFRLIPIWLFVLSSFLLAQPLDFYSSLLSESPHGARSAAMGRVHSAFFDEEVPLAANPAGLTALRRNRASLSGALDIGNAGLGATLAADGNNYTARGGGDLNLNLIGIAMPLSFEHPALVGVLAIRNSVDLNDHLTLIRYDSSNTIRAERRDEWKGGLFALSAGVGYRILPRLSIGGEVNLISGRQIWDRILSYQNDTKKISSDTSWSAKISGLSLEFGSIWSVSRALTLGGQIVFPHSLNFSDINESFQAGAVKRSYESEVSLSKPACVTVGAVLQPFPQLLIALEHRRRPWEKIETHFDGSSRNLFYENVHSFHLGVEYRISSGTLDIPLRFGYYNQPEQIFQARADERREQVCSRVFTGGFGLLSQTLQFDLAIAYLFREYNVSISELSSSPLELTSSKFMTLFAVEFFF